MEFLFSCIIAWFAIFNLATFLVYGSDKERAIEGRWRIPERILLLLAACGGSIGALLGMRFFHHKTLKPRFFVGIPLMIITQVVVFYYLSVTLQSICL